mgnify:CR=1 FL=1
MGHAFLCRKREEKKNEIVVSVWCDFSGYFCGGTIVCSAPTAYSRKYLWTYSDAYLSWNKVVKLSQVKIAADFLIDIMPPMFIPAAVGLIVVWGDLKEILIPVVVITCLSTVIVMVCTGKVTQTLIRRKQKTGEMKDERVIK